MLKTIDILITNSYFIFVILQAIKLLIKSLESNLFNNSFQASVEFEILYRLPDDSIASFTGSQPPYDILEDDQQMLIDIEQNIANIERNLSTGPQSGWNMSSDKGNRVLRHANSVVTTTEKNDRKRSSTLKSVKSLIRFGKQRPPKDSDDENVSLLHTHESGRNSRNVSESESAPISRAGSQSSLSSNAESQASLCLAERTRKALRYISF